MKPANILFLISLLYGHLSNGQSWNELGADELFQKARTEAFDGDRSKAREMLRHILVESPDYSDVRILLGRTYAWDGERAKAIEEFSIVLKKNPKYKDGINAMVDVLMWDDQYSNALKIVNSGLKYYPNFEDFLYKKASILKSLDRLPEALEQVNQLLIVSPASERGITLRESIKTVQQRNTLGLRVSTDLFSQIFDPAFYSSLQIGRSNNWGSSIVRLNYSRRFETSGLQGEIDLYPNIVSGVYGYLNYGYSSTPLFPEHRFGAELFSKLPKSLEASLGLRHLRFSASNVTIYTGSLGWYYKSMWFSFRPFITPDKSAGTSFSYGLTTRRYFGDADNFIGLNGRIGYSPDIRNIQSANGLSTDQIYTLKSQRVGIEVRKKINYM